MKQLKNGLIRVPIRTFNGYADVESEFGKVKPIPSRTTKRFFYYRQVSK